MNMRMIELEGAVRRAPAAMAVLFAVCGIGFSACEGSFDGQPSASVAETPANEQKSTAAIDASTESKASQGEPKRLVQTVNQAASAITPGNSAYKIGPLDVLDISVFKVPDLSKSVQVGETGTISMPLAGEIKAAGKTAHEVERELVSRLSSKYIQNPQVTVYVKEYNSQRATIEGAVRTPGVYPIKGRTTLVQFIALAQGLDKDTASTDVVIFRTVDGKRSAARFDISEIRNGNSDDPVIMQGDVIIVDSSTAKTVINSILRVIPVTGTFVALL